MSAPRPTPAPTTSSPATRSTPTTALTTGAIAGGSLLLGFAAAQVTGLRWAGAAVVLAGAVWCVLRERRRTAAWRIGAVLAIGVACFVAAHLLSDPLGPWVAVALVSLVLAGTTTALVRVPRNRTSAA
ncbi:hypothetical protein [Litorihabitans aurantiacus]|uniref:Uncharacterized protein n=1 Tax=Litorihabitans aurantiacus TaxID=1930061 RepID=A0AA37UKY9_9MICO|nr:hypothetical protein [Litorihabitans aurantiacus]GMA30079.1 hypothetical protein GCM10025875_00710 [Litorihabitans aurantiacus]GMA33578.1 hypothetical protein GCM10025875_35700 [Litorihabitans aurantiacus]